MSYRISDQLLDVVTDVTLRAEKLAAEMQAVQDLADEFIARDAAHKAAIQAVDKARNMLETEKEKRLSAPDVKMAISMLDRREAEAKKWADNATELASIAHERDIINAALESEVKSFNKALRTAEYEKREAKKLLRGSRPEYEAFIKIYGNGKS